MGTTIRELRDRTGLSQSKFAAQFDIPLSTLRKWEQGEAAPAPYLVALLARQIPAHYEELEMIRCKDSSIFYYDAIGKHLLDTLGNEIRIHEDLKGVKRENLPLYVQDLFESYYEIREKFEADCRFDKEEDFIWS